MNPVNRLSSPSSRRGFCPTNTAADAPASSHWFVDRPGGLQSMLQDMFGSQSAEIIEDLYAFQQKIRAAPAADGQEPDFTFLNALEFFGREGNRRVQLSEAASPAIKADYQKMVDHLQEILNAPEFLAVTKAIASKNEAHHLRNKGIPLCLVVGVIVAACFLGGCFIVPLPVYILLGASALGAAGMQLWYKAQERSCSKIGQTELGRLLGEMNQQVANAFSINSKMASYFHVDQTYFTTLSPEYSAFKCKLLALWQSLLRSGLLEQSNDTAQQSNVLLSDLLLDPLGQLPQLPPTPLNDDEFPAVVRQPKNATVFAPPPREQSNVLLSDLLLNPLRQLPSTPVRQPKNATVFAPPSGPGTSGKGGTPLHYAVWYGDEATVSRLLEAGNIDVNAKNDSSAGCTPLCWAAQYNNLSMCSLLLKNGANVNAQFHAFHNTALHEAAQAGYKDICELLLQHGAQINTQNLFSQTALHKAAEAGHADICKFLLDNGANVNAETLSGVTALQEAVEEGHAEVCVLLLKNKAVVGNSIYKAIIKYTTCIADFWQRRAGIDRKAINAKAICLLLLRHGADVNIRDANGDTPLTHLFRKQMSSDFPQYLMPKCKDLFLLLLQAGGDVNHIFEQNENDKLSPKWDPVELKKRIQQLATPLLLEKATASGDPMDKRSIPLEVIEDIIAPFLV